MGFDKWSPKAARGPLPVTCNMDNAGQVPASIIILHEAIHEGVEVRARKKILTAGSLQSPVPA